MKYFLLRICIVVLILGSNVFSKTVKELVEVLASSSFTVKYYFFPNTDGKYYLIAQSGDGPRIWHFTSGRKWQPVHNAGAFGDFDSAPKVFKDVSFSNGKVNIGEILTPSSVSFVNTLKQSTFNATHYFWTTSKVDDFGIERFYSFLASNKKDGTVSIYHLASGSKWQPVHNAGSFDGYRKAGDAFTRVIFDIQLNSIKMAEVVETQAPSSQAPIEKTIPLRTFSGHEGYIWSVDISEDMKYIFSGSRDNKIKIWDFYTGSELETIEEHSNYVYSIDVSKDGKYLASGSKDKTVKIWSIVASGNTVEYKVLHTLTKHTYAVNSVAISNNSEYIVSGSDDTTIITWDVRAGEPQAILKGHSLSVRSVAITSDSKYIVSGSDDNTIKVWDIDTGALIQTIEGHKQGVVSVAVSNDGKYIVSGAGDKTIKIWNMQTGDLTNTLVGHEQLVKSVKVSSDNKYIVSGSMDNTVRVWRLNDGSLVDIIKGHDSTVDTVGISSDNKYIISGSQDNTLKAWNLKEE